MQSEVNTVLKWALIIKLSEELESTVLSTEQKAQYIYQLELLHSLLRSSKEKDDRKKVKSLFEGVMMHSQYHPSKQPASIAVWLNQHQTLDIVDRLTLPEGNCFEFIEREVEVYRYREPFINRIKVAMVCVKIRHRLNSSAFSEYSFEEKIQKVEQERALCESFIPLDCGYSLSDLRFELHLKACRLRFEHLKQVNAEVNEFENLLASSQVVMSLAESGNPAERQFGAELNYEIGRLKLINRQRESQYEYFHPMCYYQEAVSRLEFAVKYGHTEAKGLLTQAQKYLQTAQK